MMSSVCQIISKSLQCSLKFAVLHRQYTIRFKMLTQDTFPEDICTARVEDGMEDAQKADQGN